MKPQTLFPRRSDLRPDNTTTLSTLGQDEPEVCRHAGADWERSQVCRDQHYLLNVLESRSRQPQIGYTHQEDYIKINFWLSGKHTTVLDGYGQHDHDEPEVFITAGPREMVK